MCINLATLFFFFTLLYILLCKNTANIEFSEVTHIKGVNVLQT